MRRVALLVALVVVAPATAATIHGSPRVPLIVGTPAADTILTGPGGHFVQVAFGGVDRVTCGRGVDVVSADLADVVAPNCEVVSRRLSVDLSGNPRSQHETAVEPDSAAWGSTVVAAYQLGRFQSGASSNIGFAVSRDAGRTWQRGVLPGVTVESIPPGTQTASSDPAVVYDAAHGIWLIGTLTLEQASSHVLVARSSDGLHWSTPIVAATGPLLDKDWLACDNGATSPYRGRCYVEYTDDQKDITVSQTTDDGGLTWSQPVRASTTLVGTQPVVLPDGSLVVVAGDYIGEAGLNGSMVALRSTDGGATFTRTTVSDLHAAPPGQMRALPLPSVEADSNGTIYAAWHDCRFRAVCTVNDVVLSTSTDGGVTWTPPARVPAAPLNSTQSTFITGLGADPLHPGRLGIVYAYFHPGSCARGDCLLGIAFMQSRDGGATWTAPQRLDAEPMELSWLAQAEGGRMVGDYFSTEFAGGRVVPVFALAAPPLNGRFQEAIFATSLPALR
jgi:BNR repeat protein